MDTFLRVIGRRAIVGAVILATVLVLSLPSPARSADAEKPPGLEGLLADLAAEAGRLHAAGAAVSPSALADRSQPLRDAVVAGILRLSGAADGPISVQVDVTIIGDGPNRGALTQRGVQVEQHRPDIGRAQYQVPVIYLNAVARLSGVVHLRLPAYALSQSGAVVTEGDSFLRADAARTQLGLTGEDVRIGVISSGILGLEASQASGDAPPLVEQRAFAAAGLQVDSEGTAIIEIVHDLAPDADILFANAATDLEMMQAVNFLAARVDIVIDDLAFFFPADQQSDVSLNTAQALNNPAWPIRAYITSVGNWADRHYAGRYLAGPDGSTLGLPSVGSVHRFQAIDGVTDALGSGSRSFNEIVLSQGDTAHIVLFWNDPWGQSTNDYNLFLLSDANQIVDSSELRQGLPGAVPREDLLFTNTGVDRTFRIVIQNENNAAVARELDLFVLRAKSIAPGETVLNFNSVAGSVLAQSDAPGGVIAVGAIDQADPGLDDIEPYSSRGPTVNGAIKPDVTAVDGVSITGSGDFPTPFSGTSAAAPHVAGIAALLLQAQPALRAVDGGNASAERAILRTLLVDSAVDLGVAGVDNTFGSGRIDALAAVESAQLELVTVDSAADDGPGSLRRAVETVNALPLDDLGAGVAILFAEPLTISLQSPLPPILASNVTIDGLGSTVDGAAISVVGAADGLVVQGDDITLTGLELTNLTGAALHVDGAARTRIRDVRLTDSGTGLLIDNGARSTQAGDADGVLDIGAEGALGGIVVAGNQGDGVRLSGAETGSVEIHESFIGLNADGSARGNGGAGVQIDGGASNNIVGALLPADSQVQGAQAAALVHTFRGTVTIGGVPAPIGTPVEVLLDGASQGATNVGILEEDGRALFVFTVVGPGITVTFRVDGVLLSDKIAFQPGALTDLELVVQTDATATPAVALPGGNVIAFNGAAGVRVQGAETAGNAIRGNRIHSNAGLEIDLVSASDPSSGVTPNDVDDTDVGPNGLMNRPIIETVSFSARGATISGRAESGVTVDVYVAIDRRSDPTVAANGQGFGGALKYVGTATAVSGRFALDDVSVGDAMAITALATDTEGNTSEFALNLATEPGPAIDQVTPNTGSVDGGTLLTLTGSGFVSGGGFAVLVGGVSATVESATASTVVVRTPPGVSGSASVAVLNPDGRSTVVADAFTYAPFYVVVLRPGWNNLTWRGVPTPVTAAIAPLAGRVDRVFAWDADRQVYDAFIVSAPAFLNTLATLIPGQTLWVFFDSDTPVDWEQPLS